MELNSALEANISYFQKRRMTNFFGEAPAETGYFCSRTYMYLARELERSSDVQTDLWALDLGTYFGHSAWSMLYGASIVNHSQPHLRVLSLDIFEFPESTLKREQIQAFIHKYGMPSEQAISQSLEDACKRAHIVNTIVVKKQDVTQLTPDDLRKVAPDGFKLIAVDCGKTPALMNCLVSLLTKPSVAPIGALVIFQDTLDWHSPWNIYAFWRLIENGNLAIKAMSRNAEPICEIVSHNAINPVCDESQDSSGFTDLQSELKAHDYLQKLALSVGAKAYARTVTVNKIGVYLRHDQNEAAKELLDSLDQTWPIYLSDHWLQFAYSRYMYKQTGNLDRTLKIPSIHTRNRNRLIWRVVQKGSRLWTKLVPTKSIS